MRFCASTICQFLLLVLFVASQAVPAFAAGCNQAATVSAGHGAAMMEPGSPDHHTMHGNAAASEMVSTADCCDDPEHCNMQVCLAGAAIPVSAGGFELPATTTFLSLAPVSGASLASLPLQRPPISA